MDLEQILWDNYENDLDMGNTWWKNSRLEEHHVPCGYPPVEAGRGSQQMSISNTALETLKYVEITG